MLVFPERGARFGPFVLHRSQRLLLKDEVPVRLGGRALDLLCVLVEHAGEVVSHDELIRRVWGRTVVEDTSLRVHITALRKALGDGVGERRYVANVVGRGYSFVGQVEAAHSSMPASLSNTAPAPRLPARLSRVIGRDDETLSLSRRLADYRFVTVVGPGGMGKTTLALDLARKQMAAYEDGVYFVDLAPVSLPSLVPQAVASALGIATAVDAALSVVVDRLRDQCALLVLDNCEHVIGAAADLSEAVLRDAAGVHLIATSREPLDAEGERVHRLSALRAPDAGDELTVDEALDFPVIQLFVERAAASSDGFVLSEANLPLVRELCIRLDGMPLALELAASRVESLGVAGLMASLEDIFWLLTRGRRTVQPRHRTLRALLDWSHDLLSSSERVVLRRLAVFPAGFTMKAAQNLGECPSLSRHTVMDAVMSLAAKSLLTVCDDNTGSCFAMLHVTRAYALEMLADSGERESLVLRHAEMMQERHERPLALGA